MKETKKEFSKIAEELIAEFRGVPNNEPEKMRRRPTRNLAELMEEISQKFSLGRSTPEDAIREQWKVLVGPALASSSHPVRIDRGRRLLVLVSDSVVREEIFFQRAVIVERIQAIPGCSTVTELHIRSG
ncbi:MAG: DUF721 domain-containing protein [Verrucomicrobiota bacterium]|jgi:hypothetical protein